MICDSKTVCSNVLTFCMKSCILKQQSKHSIHTYLIFYHTGSVNMQNKVISSIYITIASFLLLAVRTFWKPCHGLMEMPCERSTRIACIVLCVIIITGILKFLLKNKPAQIITSVINTIGGILLIVTPLFGKCKIASMSCNMKTFPALRLGGILIIAFTAVFAGISILKLILRSESHAHTV